MEIVAQESPFRNHPHPVTWSSGLVSKVIQELYPITMPYMPGDRIEVATDDFLTFKKNGDFDTIGIFHALVNGEKIEINRYFAESQDYPGREEKYSGWVEITHDEYIRRSIIADLLRYTTEEK